MMKMLCERSCDFQKAKTMKNKPKLASSIPLFFIILFLSLMVFAGWIHLQGNKYSKFHYSENCSRRASKSGEFFPLNCSSWNNTKRCPKKYPQPQSQSCGPSAGLCPEYFRWIHEDLRHWRETGITEKIVDKARRMAAFQLTILEGKMYVKKFRPCFQTRDLFTIWGLVQLMTRHHAQLPDLELMFDCNDHPLLSPPPDDPPPLFRYSSDSTFYIVFPDWSFWGWPETNIRPWRSTLEDIKEGNKKTKWEERVPYAYWRGNPKVCSTRLDLMQCNATQLIDWNTRLYVQNWEKETREGFQHSSLGNQCTHKYKIYIEGNAWSVSEKYILACDSPTLLIKYHWHDFFTRGMIPQHHYWPVKDIDKCRSLKFAVEWGNKHPAKAKAIGEAGSKFMHEDLKMDYVYDYIFHLLNEYAKLLKYKPKIPPNAVEVCSESLACPADGTFRKFMEESMERSGSDSVPCTMPPPYKAQEFKAFIDKQAKAIKQVEAWEQEYWAKHQ